MSLYKSGAVDEDWTRDLFLTKEVLYHWATTANSFSTLSGRRGSNPRPPAWKASALSTELLPHSLYSGGQRWIRTTEGVRQQIYSLPHLATLVFALSNAWHSHALAHCFFLSLCSRSDSRPSENGCKGRYNFWIKKTFWGFFIDSDVFLLIFAVASTKHPCNYR